MASRALNAQIRSVTRRCQIVVFGSGLSVIQMKKMLDNEAEMEYTVSSGSDAAGLWKARTANKTLLTCAGSRSSRSLCGLPPTTGTSQRCFLL